MAFLETTTQKIVAAAVSLAIGGGGYGIVQIKDAHGRISVLEERTVNVQEDHTLVIRLDERSARMEKDIEAMGKDIDEINRTLKEINKNLAKIAAGQK